MAEGCAFTGSTMGGASRAFAHPAATRPTSTSTANVRAGRLLLAGRATWGITGPLWCPRAGQRWQSAGYAPRAHPRPRRSRDDAHGSGTARRARRTRPRARLHLPGGADRTARRRADDALLRLRSDRGLPAPRQPAVDHAV